MPTATRASNSPRPHGSDAAGSLKMADLRIRRNAQGEPSRYQRDRINAVDLALQRFKFVSRPIVAAGFVG